MLIEILLGWSAKDLEISQAKNIAFRLQPTNFSVLRLISRAYIWCSYCPTFYNSKFKIKIHNSKSDVFFVFSMCKQLKHLTSVTSVQKNNTCAPTSPLIWIPCAPTLPQVYRSLINCFLREMLILITIFYSNCKAIIKSLA